MATPRQVDPSRTLTLRRRYIGEMRKRFSQIKSKIREFIKTDDSFGLSEPDVKRGILNRREFAFLSDVEKIKTFKAWLKEQIDAGILVGSVDGDHWQNGYIDIAYKRGIERTFTDVNKQGLIDSDDIFTGQQRGFTASALSAPESIEKIGLLYTQAYDALEGVTETMSKDLSRILANAIASGQGSAETARQMIDQIDGLTNRRAFAIARTETIRAHAHGQLWAMERLGIEETQAMVEFKTAGDDRVCNICASLEGTIYEVKHAYGVIPVHPNCRCAWLPFVDGKRFKK